MQPRGNVVSKYIQPVFLALNRVVCLGGELDDLAVGQVEFHDVGGMHGETESGHDVNKSAGAGPRRHRTRHPDMQSRPKARLMCLRLPRFIEARSVLGSLPRRISDGKLKLYAMGVRIRNVACNLLPRRDKPLRSRSGLLKVTCLA
jgi:hypothetical protein